MNERRREVLPSSPTSAPFARAALTAAFALFVLPASSSAQTGEIQLVDLEEHVRNIATQASVSVVTVVSIHRFPSVPDNSNAAQGALYSGSVGQGSRLEATVGSGVIIDSEGYIITTTSVIGDGGEYQITTSDGQVWSAELAGYDARTRLCLLKSSARNLRALRLGSSRGTGPGSMVVIVGRAYGNVSTVSFGAVSDRHPWKGGQGTELISTSAPVYPGNCGGAVVNLKGELIGIVSGALGGFPSDDEKPASYGAESLMRIPPEPQIMAEKAQDAQVSFAIPVETLREAESRLNATKNKKRVYFGVRVASQTSGEAADGVLLSDVVPMSPADDAGLRGGDVISAYNGRGVRSAEELLKLVNRSPLGSTAVIEFVRGGDRMKTEVLLAGINPVELKLVEKRMARQSSTN